MLGIVLNTLCIRGDLILIIGFIIYLHFVDKETEAQIGA